VTQLFVFALEQRAPANLVNRAMLGGSHEPRTGIVRHSGGWPLFERGDQRVLSEIFSDADIAHDPRDAGDELR
jgi:hypothetical protein